ncbi:LuxR family transcriptional regulator [Bradyrhizobium sp. CCGUVB1N3]|jgi:LuxR family quorum sensing-dependent transcriptional regulator|uniref:helix-turn-helix transcriptional regulator n=1 Tax=Bradyrhizobium sp. CCGUVB1N3 TaxID=2949629 RepID=UPI00273A6C49|nr:LuxR family transcriptional regulator [Bradyrhizobium sp. CCGUVB1N3]
MPWRRANYFLEHAGQLSSADEIMRALERMLNDEGISHYCLSFLPSATESFNEVTLASRFPAGFIEHYTEQDYVKDDPAMRKVRTALFPFRWQKEAPFDPEREPRAVKAVEACREAGLVDGVVIPVNSRRLGRLGQIWFGGAEFHLSDDFWPALHLSAQYAFDRIMQIDGASVEIENPLNEREREILTLAAMFLTTDQIAGRLHISERTVRWHVSNSMRKLDAINRTQAIAIARRNGFIEP